MGLKNKHTLILGKSGSGKTFLVSKAIKRGKFGPRVIILDPDGEYAAIPGVDEMTLDEAIVYCPGRTYFTVAIPMDDEETLQRDAEHVARMALAMGDCCVVFEEIADYSNNVKVRTLFRRGRKMGVRCIAISQRPAEVHKTVTSQAACVVAFRFDEPRDVEYMRLRFGREAAHTVQNLAQYEIAVWGDEKVFEKTFGKKMEDKKG